MKISGMVVSIIVASVAATGVIAAFVSNASPYVTVAQAKQLAGSDDLHLVGDLQQGTVSTDYRSMTLTFEMKDPEGQKVRVIHRGEPPQNLSLATRIVAVGKMEGEEFHSERLLVKCPSKYEGAEGGQPSKG